ncbi:hypothetical protein CWC22_018130 [Pseudoalteromonas rubra]|uniref:EamA family transporter RarD n=1 Tax=Pseudoalteromonas rubra TaxID=43658 RepID=A0A5S3V1P3_9GAMM|nr:MULTISPECIES: hypothetical protein [Pseudoalteromonas]QPB84799.1 hypothetical protein CWC22_018130 [Pseudoalteromonas rubra]
MLKYHLKGISANVIWGSLPLYFYFSGEYPPLFFLLAQIISTFILLGLYLKLMRAEETQRFSLKLNLIPALLLMLNWGGYAVAIKSGYVIEASYAYLLLPILLLSVSIFSGESNQKKDWFFFSLSLFIVFLEFYISGNFPFIGLLISVPFVLYLLWHKKHNLDPLTGLFNETKAMLPLCCLLWFFIDFGFIESVKLNDWAMLLMLGFITLLPLTLFVSASKKVSFNVLSLYQIMSPILGMIIGFHLYHQDISTYKFILYSSLALTLIVYNMTNQIGTKNESY